MAGLKFAVTNEHTNNHNQKVGLCGPWGILSRVTNVLCEDGKRRTAFVTTMEPNDAWSIDARVNIGKKAPLGRLYCSDDGEYRFKAYSA